MRAVTVLNLGRHFPVAQEHWPALCARIEELVYGQEALLPFDSPPGVEAAAQRYAALLLARVGERPMVVGEGQGVTEATAADVQSVDVDSLELTRPRSVGGEAPRLKRLEEQVALWAVQTGGFIELLIGLGLSGPLRSLILGVIIGRMAHPASERATRRWLEQRSGLGELLEVDFEAMAGMRCIAPRMP